MSFVSNDPNLNLVMYIDWKAYTVKKFKDDSKGTEKDLVFDNSKSFKDVLMLKKQKCNS